MKLTRSYWLGLGSGLILSALLSLIMIPFLGQGITLFSTKPAAPLPTINVTPTPSATTKTTTAETPAASALAPSATQPSQNQQSNNQSSSTTDRSFVIPEGASSERIADLLVAQGFIKDRKAFLDSAHQMKVESKFRSGKFNLSTGLTLEELIHRLSK